MCGVLLWMDINVSVFSQAEGEDNLKKMQLMELAILNGTYRDNNIKARKWAAMNAHAHTHPQFTQSIYFAPYITFIISFNCSDHT